MKICIGQNKLVWNWYCESFARGLDNKNVARMVKDNGKKMVRASLTLGTSGNLAVKLKILHEKF